MRTAQILLAAILFVFIAMPASAQEPEGKDLRQFYQQNCTRCHGPDGSGVSASGEKLKGRDLTNPEWRQRADDDKMVDIILNGKFFGLAMPGFEDALSEDDARRMVSDIIRKAEKGKAIAP